MKLQVDGLDGLIVSLAAEDGRYVAVSTEQWGYSPRLLASSDGRTWTAVAPAIGGLDLDAQDHVEVHGVTAHDGGFVALGAWYGPTRNPCGGGSGPFVLASTSCGLPFFKRTLAWTSPDGRRWTRVPDSPLFEEHLRLPIVLGGEILAFGTERVVASRDGVTWELRGRAPKDWIPKAAVVASAGIVAVGYVVGAEEHSRAAAWISTDGVSWSQSFLDTRGESRTLADAVAAGPAGLVALGHDPYSREEIAWHSADGGRWERTSTSLLRLQHLVGVPGGYVGTNEAAIYDSVDGVTWRSRHGADYLPTAILATPEAVTVFVTDGWGETTGAYRGPPIVRP